MSRSDAVPFGPRSDPSHSAGLLLLPIAFAAVIACGSSGDSEPRVQPDQGGSGGNGGSSTGAGGAVAGGGSGGASAGGSAGSNGEGGAGGAGDAGGAGGNDGGTTVQNDGGTAGSDGGTKPPTGANCKLGGTGYEYAPDGEVVVDRRTCLVWQRIDPEKPASCPITMDNPNGFCWLEAVRYCQALSLDGQNDWRLPTKEELLGLVDPDVGKAPRIDTNAFPKAQVSVYWTSNEVNADHAWGVDFANGMANSNIGKTGAQATRCVRGTIRDQ